MKLHLGEPTETGNTVPRVPLMTLVTLRQFEHPIGVTCVNGAQIVSVLPVSPGELAAQCYLYRSGRCIFTMHPLYFKMELKISGLKSGSKSEQTRLKLYLYPAHSSKSEGLSCHVLFPIL